MLTADAFGVMPPIARLSNGAGRLSFSIRLYGKGRRHRERRGRTGSDFLPACLGAPFMPRHPAEYGALLRGYISRHRVKCWLVNTGWTGGGYDVGRRMPIKVTRALLAAALEGKLDQAPMRRDEWFWFRGSQRSSRC